MRAKRLVWAGPKFTRTRWFAAEGVEVVVDVYEARIVTVWRKGDKS